MVTRRRLLTRPTRASPARQTFQVTDFWAVVASMPAGTPVLDMVGVLRGLTPTAREAFVRHLSDAVAEIDTPEHRREAALAHETGLPGDPEVGWAVTSGTAPRAVRVELQLTVVVLGREAWAAAARTPAVLRGAWPTQLGRRLAHALAVADGQAWSDGSGRMPSTT